jgi:hypothetical protein
VSFSWCVDRMQTDAFGSNVEATHLGKDISDALLHHTPIQTRRTDYRLV